MTEHESTNGLDQVGRLVSSAYYDFQQVRLGAMNRIRDIVRKRTEGIKFNEVEDKKDIKDYTKKYKDDALIKKWSNAYTNGIISKNEFDYLIECYDVVKESRNLEDKYKNTMKKFVKTKAVYLQYLSKIRGMGPILSTNVIKNFGDCSQYETVSKLWAHCGYSVVNGKTPKREKGQTINYNPKLKTLVWKISDSLMKLNKGFYRKVYDEEKSRQAARIFEKGELAKKYNGYGDEDVQLSKGHAHNRALRKMAKIFLDHYWHAARQLNGLKAEKNYVEGVLNHQHVIPWETALDMETSTKSDDNKNADSE